MEGVCRSRALLTSAKPSGTLPKMPLQPVIAAAAITVPRQDFRLTLSFANPGDFMRKLTTLGIAVSVAAVSALLMAAIPQDASPARAALKYGDRCLSLIGKDFYVIPGSTSVRQGAKGPYRLVTVGVDFVEFESGEDRVVMSLASLSIVVEKP